MCSKEDKEDGKEGPGFFSTCIISRKNCHFYLYVNMRDVELYRFFATYISLLKLCKISANFQRRVYCMSKNRKENCSFSSGLPYELNNVTVTSETPLCKSQSSTYISQEVYNTKAGEYTAQKLFSK
jgi:hypothetical protein